MKFMCTACENAPASLLCSADEALLCSPCDARIHNANSKKQRVGLSECKRENKPTCDICQDATAFIFCREDRAVLCRRCDFSIHSANKLAEKHERYLLGGVMVALHPTSASGVEQSASGEGYSGKNNSGQRSGKDASEEGDAPCSSKSNDAPLVPDIGQTVEGQRQGKARVRGSLDLNFKGKGYDSMPQWRVDELLDIPGLADGYNIHDIDALAAGDLGDMDYDFGCLLEVPDMGDMGGVPHAYPQGYHQQQQQPTPDMYSSDDGMGVVPEMDHPAPPESKRQRR